MQLGTITNLNDMQQWEVERNRDKYQKQLLKYKVGYEKTIWE